MYHFYMITVFLMIYVVRTESNATNSSESLGSTQKVLTLDA